MTTRSSVPGRRTEDSKAGEESCEEDLGDSELSSGSDVLDLDASKMLHSLLTFPLIEFPKYSRDVLCSFLTEPLRSRKLGRCVFEFEDVWRVSDLLREEGLVLGFSENSEFSLEPAISPFVGECRT